MKLHEYQSKEIFRNFGIPVPRGHVVTTAEAVPEVTAKLGKPPWVIKAQVHAGGRGKAGGVRVVRSPEEMMTAVQSILQQPLITKQTGPEGKRVHQVLIEEGVEIDRELYLAIVIDRSMAMPAMIQGVRRPPTSEP